MASVESASASALAVGHLEARRLDISDRLDRAHRAKMGQFFTPADVADFMASLLDFSGSKDIHLLDPGAGIGSLTAAVARKVGRRKIHATCYELESIFQSELAETLSGLPSVSARIEARDFIEQAVRLVTAGQVPGYSHAILNPPYRKINTDSSHRSLMRKVNVETSNLYTCFLACTIALCRPGAQVVAIVPRSFMNGVYFKPFRYWLLEQVALTHIHVFDSRDRAFGDDDVLQENVIIRMVVGGAQETVEVSTSHDHTFSDLRTRVCGFGEIVSDLDEERFIHVPAAGAVTSTGLPGLTLKELGLDVCTGPVVDFRLRQHLLSDPDEASVPLLYSTHFRQGQLKWPKEGRKPNAILRNAMTEKWLMPSGCYVVLRRFTSKEEKRRVVAYLLDESALPGDVIGFENHLNVIHEDRHGLPATVARGLVKYLNSQEVDDYFRVFSGHTQVNATDLRRLRYPSLKELEELGRATIASEREGGAEHPC